MRFLPARFLLLSATTAMLASLPTFGTAQTGPQFDLPREQLSAGLHRIDAQVAGTPEEHQIGLMLRAEMPSYEGMLFVFDEPAVQCFWMKNTLLPLTAAFVDDQGRIVNLVDMQPQTTASHCSTAPVRYVLEMNQGWFAQRHIAAGARLSGARFAPPTTPTGLNQPKHE